MKKWYRTVPGKTLLFLLTVILLLLAAVGGTTSIWMAEQNYYIRNQESLEEMVHVERTFNEARGIAEICFMGWKQEEIGSVSFLPEDMEYEVRDPDNKTVIRTEGFDETKPTRVLAIGVMTNQNGIITDVFVTEQPHDDAVYYTIESYFTNDEEIAGRLALVRFLYPRRVQIPIATGVCGLLGLFCLIGLLCAAARRPDSEDLFPGPLNRIPPDIMLLLLIAAVGGLAAFIGEIIFELPMLAAGVMALILILAVAWSMYMAGHIKQKNLIRSTLTAVIVRWVFRFIKAVVRFFAQVISGLPLIWRTVLITGALCLVELIFLLANRWEPDNQLLFWFVEKLVLIPCVLYAALSLRKLEKGGKALAEGDLQYRTQTDRMLPALRAHGENLNHAAQGMNTAVEERLKSERMKTELLTNVSHDIKTPLTSIINYAGLISREPCENEKIHEYSEVLTRQSERLKRLIEDLIEASKASTGNLEVELVPCDARILLEQTAGEYDERLRSAGLTLMISKPQTEPVMILADGRRMWRIMENLMGNICKYAMAGTRVYLSLEETEKEAVITFRNTSREALNISADELKERFVRGERSRHSEGNGLGLSIAESFASLQNGSLDIQIDGDLFKAILRFPLIQAA